MLHHAKCIPSPQNRGFGASRPSSLHSGLLASQLRENAPFLPPGNWLDEFLGPPWLRPLRREGAGVGGGDRCWGWEEASWTLGEGSQKALLSKALAAFESRHLLLEPIQVALEKKIHFPNFSGSGTRPKISIPGKEGGVIGALLL